MEILKANGGKKKKKGEEKRIDGFCTVSVLTTVVLVYKTKHIVVTGRDLHV